MINPYLARTSSSADLNQTLSQFVTDGYRVRQVFLEHDGRYMIFAELTPDAIDERRAQQRKERVIPEDAIIAALLKGDRGLRQISRDFGVSSSTVFKIKREAQERGIKFPAGPFAENGGAR